MFAGESGTQYIEMPSISHVTSDDIFEPFESFAILNRDTVPTVNETFGYFNRKSNYNVINTERVKNVNVVKPVLRNKQDVEDSALREGRAVGEVTGNRERFAPREQTKETTRKRARKLAEVPVHPQTILDPSFSRNLDLKLRRLKEKEIIAERISKRAKERQKRAANTMAVPKISVRSVPLNARKISTSQPNVSTIKTRVNLGSSEAVDLNEGAKSTEAKSTESLLATGGDGAAMERNRKISRSSENTLAANNSRPLFITTVRKGQFLPPPPGMASLLGLENYDPGSPALYTYSSRPKVVQGSPVVTTAPSAPPAPSSIEIPAPVVPRPGLAGAARALAALTSLAVKAAGMPSGGGQATNLACGNLMTDRRIIRGSTLAAAVQPAGFGGGDAGLAARAAEARRRAVARRRAPKQGTTSHLPAQAVQTEPYLEELFDKGEEMEVGVQTDLLGSRPGTPVFVPQKTGCDQGTQIMPGDLFEFDEEVGPVLEVLVDRALQQALAECVQEEELLALRKQAAAGQELRAAAAASARHHQRHIARAHHHKERRLAAERAGAELARSGSKRAAAAALVRAHLPPLLPAVLDALKEHGYLRDDADAGVDENFMPWLLSEVSQEVESMITSREVLMDIVKEVLDTRAELFRAMGGEGELSSEGSSTADLTSAEPQAMDDEENFRDG